MKRRHGPVIFLPVEDQVQRHLERKPGRNNWCRTGPVPERERAISLLAAFLPESLRSLDRYNGRCAFDGSDGKGTALVRSRCSLSWAVYIDSYVMFPNGHGPGFCSGATRTPTSLVRTRHRSVRVTTWQPAPARRSLSLLRAGPRRSTRPVHRRQVLQEPFLFGVSPSGPQVLV